MDLVMPVKSGIEAIQELRLRPELAETVIVAVSASVLEADQERSRIAGADAFLPKPIQAQKLLDMLADHLGLAWEYKEGVEAVVEYEQADIVPPSPEILEALYRFARQYDYDGLSARLEEIEGHPYQPFTSRIREMAKKYQMKEILQFIQHYMENNG